MNWLRRILHLPLDGEVIRRADPAVDCFRVQREASESLAQRQRAARDAMGTKWICHPRHATKVSREQFLRDWESAITEDGLRGARPGVIRFHRRGS